MSDSADVQDPNDHHAQPRDAEHRDAGGSGYASIIIQGDAVARIEAEMAADAGGEPGGVLIGNASPSTNFVLITGSIAADAGSEHFTFTAAALEGLAREVAATNPGRRIVGWYHSHPRSGIFLADDDLDLHSAFFAQPWQVGYVYDPVNDQRGFFGWSDREIVRVPRWEVTRMTEASGLDLAVNASAQTPAHPADNAFDPAIEEPAFGAAAAIGATDVETGHAVGSPAGSPAGSPTAFGAPARHAPVKKRPIAAILTAAAVVIAIVIAAIVINSGDDDDTSPSTSPDSTSSASLGGSSTESPAETFVTTQETDPSSSTDAPTSASTGESAATEITFAPTPSSVQTPAARVGASAVRCEQTAEFTYAPLSDCFVPLDNGNVLVFVSGSLRCVDPSGEVLAAEAETFTIGALEDPVALVVDDTLTPSCIDLGYAKNVLAGGSTTLDGLCGSSGTQINEGTRRCLGHNSTSGAMVAVVRSTETPTELVASCTTADDEASTAPISWSVDVSTLWVIESVIFDDATNRFAATASRAGATATATISCG